jgi:plasmid maintenance system antidote protein VapI
VESTIEERLADEVDLSLDQLARWSRVSYARVRKWAELEIDITDEETVRLRTIIVLYQALYARLVLAGEVLDETFGKPGKNGSVK